MAQNVFLAKDIKIAVKDGTTVPSNVEASAEALHGEGDGLVSFAYNDPSDIQEKAGAGTNRFRYVTGIRRPSATLTVQAGSVTWGKLMSKHGTEMSALVHLPGDSATKVSLAFQFFVNEPEVSIDVNAGGIELAFELMINGGITYGSYS